MSLYGYYTENARKSRELQWSREQQSRGHATNKKKVSRAKRQRDKLERKRQNAISRERSIKYLLDQHESNEEMIVETALKVFWILFILFIIAVFIGIVYINTPV